MYTPTKHKVNTWLGRKAQYWEYYRNTNKVGLRVVVFLWEKPKVTEIKMITGDGRWLRGFKTLRKIEVKGHLSDKHIDNIANRMLTTQDTPRA